MSPPPGMHKKRRISGNGENSRSTSSFVVSNSDLLIQILLCLPVKSLLVFKSVSKLWYSLISDSYFMQKHCALHSSKLSVSGLFFPTPGDQHIRSYDMHMLDIAKVNKNVSFVIQVNERPVDLHIEQSCNGLLLCYGFAPSVHMGTRYVYNPSTKQYRTIPPPPQFQKDINGGSYRYQFCLAFWPQESLNYEVACTWSNDDETYDYQIEIYSSNTRSWRPVNYMLYFNMPSRPGVYWNGCLNWINISTHTLFYFNITQEVLKTLSFSNVMNNMYVEYFGECMGHMHLLLGEKGSRSNCFFVFEMEIDYSGWRQKYRVDLNGFARLFGNCRLNYRIMLVVEGYSDEDESKALILLRHKIISYDLKKMSSHEIYDYPMGQFVHYSQDAYIGSLANV